MRTTLTKDVTIAGVPHKSGEELDVTPAVAVLLADCSTSGKAKKKAAKKEAPSAG